MELRTEEHSVGELLKSSTPKQPVCVLSFLWSDLAVGFFSPFPIARLQS